MESPLGMWRSLSLMSSKAICGMMMADGDNCIDSFITLFTCTHGN